MDIGKQYSVLYKLQAQLDSAFASTFTKAQASVASMQKEIQDLNKTQGNIAAYQKQQSAVEATQKKLEVLQQQYDNIQKEIQETEGYSSSLENKLLSKQQQIDKTSASLQSQTQKLQEMERALQEAGVDTDNLTGESARLGTQIDELKRKQEEAAESAGAFGDAGEEAFANVKEALVAAGLVAALKEIGDAYMECVGIAGDFEEAMSTVEALSGASAQEMAALSAEAKELGASTKFTAKEAADAMGYMGMAGWSAADMLQGMDGVLQLAAASGEDLARVSDIVTDNLTAFGLTAADTAHFSDVLAAAATNANTNVSIMGETFKMSAPLAGALGYSIEDVSVAIGLMANSGIKGSLAGTSLKNVFNGLLEGVTLTSAAFGEYDFTAVKADGTMKDFGSTIEELRGYFDQMTEAEKMSNAEAIAGLRGYAGLLAILNATEEDYASLTNELNNCAGAAERMANIKLDNMNGQLTIAKSAWDGLKISIGEQFTPAMQRLYEVAAQVFGAINEFIKKNPGIVKAIASIVAGLAAATATILGVAAAVKAAQLAQAAWNVVMNMNPIVLMTTAVVGLGVAVGTLAATYEGCQSEYESLTATSRAQYDAMQDLQAEYEKVRDTMGETSAEAQLLKRELDDATAAYENNKTTTKELAEANRAVIDAHNELMAAYEETIDGIDTEAESTVALGKKLEDLMSVEGKTAKTKKEILAVVELLNEAMPQLGLAYDQYADSLNMGADAVLRMARAEAAREKNKAMYDQLKEQISKEAELEANLTREREETAKRQKEFDEKYVELSPAPAGEAAARKWASENAGALARNKEVIDALAAQQAEEAKARTAYEENQAQIEQLSSALGGYGDVAETTGAAVVDRINETGAAMQSLVEKYNEAYTAAYESVSGQYEIWDQADQVVATSVGNINANLESQAKYWEDYNANLATLRDRTEEIEGLQEVIASFADGSPESVNAIAGMVNATDSELAEMVENFQAVQDAQRDTSDSLAEMKTNFDHEMDELTRALEEDIAEMNFSDEAGLAAQDTVQSYIDAANDMLPRVQAAYGAIGDAASKALSQHKNTGWMGSYFDIPGHHYADGTNYARQGMALVGENGPELVYMQNHRPELDVDPRPELPKPFFNGGGYGGFDRNLSVRVDVHVDGNASQDTVDALDAKAREIADMVADEVMDRIRDEQDDADRRAYR